MWIVLHGLAFDRLNNIYIFVSTLEHLTSKPKTTMSRIFNILGGLMIAISVFLAAVKSEAMSVSMFDTEEKRGVAYFFIVLGVIIAVVGLVNKRWLNILSLLLGLAVAGLAFKYKGDATTEMTSAGMGIWLMLAGGLLACVGSVMGIMNKGTSAPAA